MAAYAGSLFAFAHGVRPFDCRYSFLMAFATGLLGDFAAGGGDPDVVFESASGEIERMPEAVSGFRCVLADEARGRVAVVASSD